MSIQTVLYLHGFASSPHGTKARYLQKKLSALPHVQLHVPDFNPTPRDIEYMTTTGLIDRLRQYVLDHKLQRVLLIGSSHGGLIALHYAHRHGGVTRMLLLAPGLAWLSGGLSDEELAEWERSHTVSISHPAFDRKIPVRYDLQVDGLRYLDRIPPPTPVLIIHGQQDETVPIDHSREYAARYPERVQLIEVQADHDLSPHLGMIWQHTQAFLLGDGIGPLASG
jgi:pimeloyl-ACP methyl ester carboxylesterase